MLGHTPNPEVTPAPAKRSRRGKDGFTLIELMIVIALIIVIAAIAIPNLIRSRITTNEGAAIANLRTINSAEQQFQAAAANPFPSGIGRYGSLAQMAAAVPSFIEQPLALGQRQGYNYLVVPGGVDGAPAFAANADPIVMDGTGSRGFFTDESGVITGLAGGVAGPNDLPVQ